MASARQAQSFVGYYRATTLEGFKDSINALAISGDGRWLVSGGEEGLIRIFSMTGNYDELCRFQNSCGILSIAWLNQFSFTFLVGDMVGDVYTLRVLLAGTKQRDVKEAQWVTYYGGRVYSIVVHTTKSLVAVAHGRHVSISTRTAPMPAAGDFEVLPSAGMPPELQAFKVSLSHEIPFSMDFDKSGDMLAVTYYQHGTVGWNVQTKQKLWHIPPYTACLGHSRYSPEKALLCRANLYNGLDWIHLSSRGTEAEFAKVSHHDCQTNYAVPVIFIENGDYILIGGDKGKATIWSLTKRQPVQVLTHSTKDDLVQALAVRHTRSRRLIVTATARKSQSSTGSNIIVWTQKDQEFTIAQWMQTMNRRSSRWIRKQAMRVVFGYLIALVIGAIFTLVIFDPSTLRSARHWFHLPYVPVDIRWKNPFTSPTKAWVEWVETQTKGTRTTITTMPPTRTKTWAEMQTTSTRTTITTIQPTTLDHDQDMERRFSRSLQSRKEARSARWSSYGALFSQSSISTVTVTVSVTSPTPPH